MYRSLRPRPLTGTKLERAGSVLDVSTRNGEDCFCNYPSDHLTDADGAHSWVFVKSNECITSHRHNSAVYMRAARSKNLPFGVLLLKPRSQCYVRPCVPFRNVVAEYCECNLRITARTCGAYGGLRKDRSMFYPCVACVADDQSKCIKFSPRGRVHSSSELRYRVWTLRRGS